GQESHLASVLDRLRDQTLLLHRDTGDTTGADLAALGHELAKRCDVLVVNDAHADRLRGSGGLATLPRLAAVAARLSSHEFSLRRFRMPGPFDRPRPRELERGVVAEAARGAPRVSARRAGGRPRLLRDLLLRAATALEASATAAGCGPRDLCRRITQRRTELVNLQLDRRAVVAVAVLVGALTQTALLHDAHALRQQALHAPARARGGCCGRGPGRSADAAGPTRGRACPSSASLPRARRTPATPMRGGTALRRPSTRWPDGQTYAESRRG